MTAGEFRKLLALIWGQHGAQSEAARHFGVSDRTVRYWAAGKRNIPEEIQRELLSLAARSPLPPIAPPPAGSTPDEDRDDACAESIWPAYSALCLAAENAGWAAPEILTALLSHVVTDMRRMSSDDATRQTLSAAIMMLDE